MKIIGKLKIGGLQQKIFNLMLFFILALIGVYAAVAIFQQRNLTSVVQEASTQQQRSIDSVSEETMEAVMNASLTQTTALQAYIANELFVEVRGDVLTLQAFAEELFVHAEIFSDREVSPPSRGHDGKPAAQLVHEEGVDPADSKTLGLLGNMSEIMLAMYESSDKLSSVFVGTTDGNMILVNDRPSTFVAADRSPLALDIRHRPWYTQASESGDLVFTGVELDAYTDIPMLECAAPVYCDGELVAVVGADIWLTSISDYVESKSSEGSFLCVMNGDGQILFSPIQDGVFKVGLSADSPDLREHENTELSAFVRKALRENTGLVLVKIDGEEYYMCGVPLDTLGWSVLSVVNKELTRQPTQLMLNQYDEINNAALGLYKQGAKHSEQTILIVTIAILILAIAAAMVLASHVVKPLERMTRRLNDLGDNDQTFEMEPIFRTGDEIEILAESFASMFKRTRNYIAQITRITAEKERIGTELALATRIQGDMLPSIFPAFPEKREFDIYASMDPAKEVGGDFYDFFLIDDDHLCLLIADVSGKGVPAALFMMASKIILANNAMMGKSPAQILNDTNAAICANNREEMFVTAWLGILELSTGKLTAVNAGHEYPALRRADGSFELFKDKHGLVVGAMDMARYNQYELQLHPGDSLFVYTDGVPEAMDADNALFGTERMLTALNDAPGGSPQQLLAAVRSAVDDFVKDAEQFDDLTMLCMEYKGGKPA